MGTSYFIGRDFEISEIITEIKKQNDSSDLKNLINIYGIGGAGKTTLLDVIFDKLNEEKERLVYFRVNEDVKFKSIPVFIDELSKTIKGININIDNDFKILHDKVIFYQKAIGDIESKFTPTEKEELDKIEKKRLKLMESKGKRKYRLPEITIGDLNIAGNEVKGGGIGLGEIQGAEKDLNLLNEVYNKKYKDAEKRIISERYQDDATQKFLINPMDEINECFMNSLMESIYYKSIYIRKNKKFKPVKVIIVIDTFEKVSDEINEWLLRFVNFVRKDIYLNKYDFRFIVSGRERLLLTDHYKKWDVFKDRLLEKDIQNFTKEEIQAYLAKRNLDTSLLEKVQNDTEGIPYIVEMWCDYQKDNFLIYTQTENRIFWWKNDIQKEWIRAAAFLDYYDVDSLKLFFQDNALEAFEYLKECHEVTRSHDTNAEKLQLHPTIKMVLQKSTGQRSPDLHQEYKYKADLHKEMTSLFPDYLIREKMFRLSLFNHFNQSSYEKISNLDAFTLNDFVNQNEKYFQRCKHTFQMRNEWREKLYNYKNYKDPDWMKDNLQVIKETWNNKKIDVETKLSVLNKDKQDLENTKNMYIARKVSKQKDIDALNKKAIDNSDVNKTEELSNITNIESTNVTIPFWAFLILGLLLIILSFIISEFKFIFLILSGFSFIMSLVFFIYNKNAKNKNTKNKHNESEITENKESFFNKTENEKAKQILNIEFENIVNDINNIDSKIILLQSDINGFNEILEEPYC